MRSFSDPLLECSLWGKKQNKKTQHTISFHLSTSLYFNPTTVCPKGGRSTGYGVKSDQSHHVNKHTAAFQHEQSSELNWKF